MPFFAEVFFVRGRLLQQITERKAVCWWNERRGWRSGDQVGSTAHQPLADEYVQQYFSNMVNSSVYGIYVAEFSTFLGSFKNFCWYFLVVILSQHLAQVSGNLVKVGGWFSFSKCFSKFSSKCFSAQNETLLRLSDWSIRTLPASSRSKPLNCCKKLHRLHSPTNHCHSSQTLEISPTLHTSTPYMTYDIWHMADFDISIFLSFKPGNNLSLPGPSPSLQQHLN